MVTQRLTEAIAFGTLALYFISTVHARLSSQSKTRHAFSLDLAICTLQTTWKRSVCFRVLLALLVTWFLWS